MNSNILTKSTPHTKLFELRDSGVFDSWEGDLIFTIASLKTLFSNTNTFFFVKESPFVWRRKEGVQYYAPLPRDEPDHEHEVY